MPPYDHARLSGSKIFVAGHRGMVGSAIVRQLRNIKHIDIISRTSGELNLIDQAVVREFFAREKIDYVVLAAARVGGILANNTFPAEFIYQNLMIQNNVIHEAYRSRVKGLLFLGSSCIYPRDCPQPMREEHLLTGILESTNEPYAVAKIAGIKMCEAYNRQYGTDFRAVMPTNLYGPGDNYHLENSHVIPAMIRKYHLAKLACEQRWAEIESDERQFGPIPSAIRTAIGLDRQGTEGHRITEQPYVALWGSGLARREFLHVDDMASACLHVLSLDQDKWQRVLGNDRATKPTSLSFINVGVGSDCTISQAAEEISRIVGFGGETRYDTGKPDGTPRKLLDTTRLDRLGWRPAFSLKEGLADAYHWYLQKLAGKQL